MNNENLANRLFHISDSKDERIQDFLSVRERDLVKRDHLFIAEGRVVLNIALNTNHFDIISVLVSQNRLPLITPLLIESQQKVPVYVAEQSVMDKIAGFHIHRGVLAVGRKKPSPEILSTIDALPEEALVIVLQGINNHDNLGSIFRNAAAFGADYIFLDAMCCDPLYRKAIRVSVGAALKVPFIQYGSVDTIIAALQNANFSILALSPSGRNNIYKIQRARRRALLLGTEGEGLPKALLQKLTTARIPMAPDFDSLNVATACGIALSCQGKYF